MAFDEIQHVLTSSISEGARFTIDYPSGRAAEDYDAPTAAHKIFSQRTYPLEILNGDFEMTLGASEITITIRVLEVFVQGETIYINLETGSTIEDRVQELESWRLDTGLQPETDALDDIIAAGIVGGADQFLVGLGSGSLAWLSNSASRIALGLDSTASPTFAGLTIGAQDVTAVLDEDNMSSNSDTAIPTQQSVKAYVDSAVSSSTTFAGGYDAATNTPDLDTSPSGINLGDTYVVSAAGTFFSAAVVEGNILIAGQNNPTLESHWTIIQTSNDAASIKSLYESNANTNALTDALLSKLNAIEASADVTDTANVTAAGALMDSELVSIAAVKALNQGVATTDSPTFAAITVTGNVDGRDLSVDGSKLDGIEAGADVTDTANVTAAGALMDSEVSDVDAVKGINQNLSTTSDPSFASVSSTGGVSIGDGQATGGGAVAEIGRTGDRVHIAPTDQSGALETTKDLTFDPSGDAVWTAEGGFKVTGDLTVTGTVAERDLSADGAKLDGIEAGATADQTASEIMTAVQTVDGAGSGLDADLLDGIHASDFVRRDAEDNGRVQIEVTDSDFIVSDDNQSPSYFIWRDFDAGVLYIGTSGAVPTFRANLDMNARAIVNPGMIDGRDVSADGSKLDGIEAGADVTDAASVTAAGALMDSELANVAAVKALNQGVATTDSPTFAGITIDSRAITDILDEDNMVSNSATALATQQSIKAYIDSATSAALTYQGGYNASSNTPDLDTSPSGSISTGHTYAVTDAGTFFATAVVAGDLLIANQDAPTLEAHWTIVQASTSAATIKTQYESNADTNAFTDALLSKLNAIESSATADQSAAEILAALLTVDGAASTLDADLLDGKQGADYVAGDGSDNGAVTIRVDDADFIVSDSTDPTTNYFWRDHSGAALKIGTNDAIPTLRANFDFDGFNLLNPGTVDGRDVATDGTKLDGIEAGATADQTAAEILAAVKTVDGAASGLDADLLDGKEGSRYIVGDATDNGRVEIIVDDEDFIVGDSTDTPSYYLWRDHSAEIFYIGTPTARPTLRAPLDMNGTDLLNPGEVDGRDVSVDGTKLDGIETGATADQTASEILTLVKTVDGAASGLDADFLDGLHASSFVLGGGTDNGALTITVDDADFKVSDSTDGTPDFIWRNHSAQALYLGTAHAIPTLRASMDLAGYNLVNAGTIDGRDVATDGTKLDGIEAGATADQSASEILTAVKTVDGSGSGLDADLLDGLHAEDLVRGDGSANPGTVSIVLNSADFKVADTADSANYIWRDASEGVLYLGFSSSIPTLRANFDFAGYNLLNPGTIDGRDVGVDGAKLDGIETGATADQTGSEILAALVSVDGAASGLDADLLDGMHASSLVRGDGAANSGAVSIIVDDQDFKVGDSTDASINFIWRDHSEGVLFLGTDAAVPTLRADFDFDGNALVDAGEISSQGGWKSFASRADLVTWVISNTPVDGALYFDGSHQYVGATGSTAISDLSGLNPLEPYHLDQWGVVREANTGQSSSSENNAIAIQTALDWVGDNGGGIIRAGGGVIAYDSTIYWGDRPSGVVIQGNGRGVPSSGKSLTRQTPGTRFLWGGSAGDRGLVLTADRTDTGGTVDEQRAGSSGILDCFIDGGEVGTASTAAGGPMLSVISMNDMQIRVLIGYAPGGCFESTTLVNSLQNGAGDTQRGFVDVETTDVNTSSEPYWHVLMTGKDANNENSSLLPSIKMKLAPESTAIAAHLEFLDGSRFEFLHTSTRTTASGDGGKVILHADDTLNTYHGGAYSNEGHIRRVTFDYVQATEGVISHATVAGTHSAGPCIIKHYSRGNGAPSPTIEAGSVLHYWDENVGIHTAPVVPSYTAAEIADIGDLVNTAGKVTGKTVYDTTNRRLMIARGSAAGGAWDIVDGSASVTPS